MQDFKFIWKIENFNFLPPQRGKALKSPSFNVYLLGSTFLELFPKGDILDPDGEYIIICLNNGIKLPHTSVSCDVQLVTVDSSSQFKTEKIHDCSKWRFKKEPEHTRMFSCSKSSDSNDADFSKSTLTVTCKFSQNTDMAKSNHLMKEADAKDMMLLSKDMERMYIDQQFSDVTLCTGNEKFPAHKAVLYARLPKLVRDLETESDNEHRDLSDIEPSVLKTLLEYAYSGKISAMNRSIPGGLYEIANFLELTDLKHKIYSYPNKVTARTCVKVDRNVFTWPIKDIQNMELNKKIYSPTFTGCVIRGSDLKLACYLTKNAEDKLTLEICVHRLFPDKNNPIFVKCKITVIDLLTFHRSAEHVFVADEEWHFPSFIPVTRQGQNVYVGPSLYSKTANHGVPLKCEFSISGCETSEIEETECSSTRYDNFVRSGEDVRSLCTDLGQLYNIFLPKVSDVTLLIGDVRFPAHKAVLAARSPVFLRMFTNDMLEKKSGVVKITDIDIAVLNMMLKYIYSAKVDILNYDSAIKLYSAADKYEVTSLKERCAAFLKDLLCSENSCDILLLADMHGDSDLKIFAREFIQAHADVILETSEWKNLMENRIDLATEILHSLISIVLRHNRECGLCNK